MSDERRNPIAAPPAGKVLGSWNDDVASFAGIPYAEAPVGELRWAPPRAAAAWSDTRIAHEPGAVHPQPPARLEAVMGPLDAPGPGEDCLSLNLWTPAPGSAEHLPVLVFLHGGGLLSGAGSATWYDGTVMSRRGPAVVVTVNFRLGALGYMYLPPEVTGGDPIGNLALQDQRLALEWVRENIAAFGGDPGNVTVFGQSGGGHAAVALRAMTGTESLFRRAILQSAPLGMEANPPGVAERSTRVFLEALGRPKARIEELRELELAQIMDAQRQTLMQTAAPGKLEPPFQLVVDGHVLSAPPMAAAHTGSLDGLDLLIGITAEEARAFLAVDDALWALGLDELAGRLEAGAGEAAARALRAYAGRRPGDAAAALSDLVSDQMFVAPAVRLAESDPNPGKNLGFYRFSWASDALDGRLGACHTIELPFVFNNFDAWRKAPMLGAAADAELSQLGDTVQDAWLNFAATGDPGGGSIGEWPRYDPDGKAVVDFGSTVELIADVSDSRRDLWRG